MYTVLEMKIWIYWSKSNSWIYFYKYLNNNWRIYRSEQSFAGVGPEDWCWSWGLYISMVYSVRVIVLLITPPQKILWLYYVVLLITPPQKILWLYYVVLLKFSFRGLYTFVYSPGDRFTKVIANRKSKINLTISLCARIRAFH
jgi:hypothetical protein